MKLSFKRAFTKLILITFAAIAIHVIFLDDIAWATVKFEYTKSDPAVVAFYKWWDALSRKQQDSIVKDLVFFGILNTKPGSTANVKKLEFPPYTTVVWVDHGNVWLGSWRRDGIVWLVQPVDRDINMAFYPRITPTGLDSVTGLYSATSLTRQKVNAGLDFGIRRKPVYTYWDFVDACDKTFARAFGVHSPIVHKNSNMAYLDTTMRYFHYAYVTTSSLKANYDEYTLDDIHAVHYYSDDFFSQSDDELAAFMGTPNHQTEPIDWGECF